MKRWILTAAVLLLVFGTIAAAITNTAEDFRYGTTRLFGRGGQFSLWASEMESAVEALTADPIVTTGNVLYVDSNVDTEDDGSTWAKAYDTLQEAVAVAEPNDIIYVAPGHNESLTAADAVDLNVAGLTVIGCGSGSLRPRFDFDHADGEFVIGAVGVTVRNLTFLPSVTAVTHCIDVENAGDWATIEDCEFLEGEAVGTDEFIDCIQVGTTATNVTIRYNVYTLIGGAGANNFVDLSAATISNPRVYGNIIAGQFAEAGIWGGAAVPTDCFIVGNTVTNLTASQFCIEFQGNATGVCTGNICHAATVDYEVDPGTMYSEGNSEGATMPEGTSIYDLVGALFTSAAGTGVYPTGVTDDSIIAMILSKSATTSASSYNNTTDSLEAISDAITAVDDYVDTEVAAIKVVTDASEKVISKALTTIANGNNDLFVVAGGPIKILEIVTYVTTQIGAEGCLIGYNVDPTAPATDTVFGTDGTAVECNAAAVGTILTWNGTVGADLLKQANGVAIGGAAVSGLIVPAGSIELTAAHDGTCDGALKTYMRYIPLDTGVTVTAAP